MRRQQGRRGKGKGGSWQRSSLGGKDDGDEEEKTDELRQFGLHRKVVKAYRERGLKSLYDWQRDCLASEGVLDEGRNLVYSAPTSGGKTLVSEILIFRHLSTRKEDDNSAAMLVLPFVSVVTEKEQTLRGIAAAAGWKVAGFYSGSKAGLDDDFDIAICTIEKANIIVNRLIHQGTLRERLALIVIDELHMVGDAQRGYLLELVLTKILFFNYPDDAKENKEGKDKGGKEEEGISQQREAAPLCQRGGRMNSFLMDADEEPSAVVASNSRTKTTVGKQMNKLVQIVGMSATLPNIREVARWLRASCFESAFRPVPLKEMLVVGGKTLYVKPSHEQMKERGGGEVRAIQWPDDWTVQEQGKEADGKGTGGVDAKIVKSSSPFSLSEDPDGLLQACYESLLRNDQVLVFCPSKRECEVVAKRVSLALPDNALESSREGGKGCPSEVPPLPSLEKEIQESRNRAVAALRGLPCGLDPTLAVSLPQGVAYHTSALTVEERRIIENAYRKGAIRLIAATSTLAAGVNLPAGRVVLKGPRIGIEKMCNNRYRQMAGRAGRAGQRERGEAVMLCNIRDARWVSEMMCADSAPLDSCLLEEVPREHLEGGQTGMQRVDTGGASSGGDSPSASSAASPCGGGASPPGGGGCSATTKGSAASFDSVASHGKGNGKEKGKGVRGLERLLVDVLTVAECRIGNDELFRLARSTLLFSQLESRALSRTQMGGESQEDSVEREDEGGASPAGSVQTQKGKESTGGWRLGVFVALRDALRALMSRGQVIQEAARTFPPIPAVSSENGPAGVPGKGPLGRAGESDKENVTPGELTETQQKGKQTQDSQESEAGSAESTPKVPVPVPTFSVKAVARASCVSGMSPQDGLFVEKELRRAAKRLVLRADLHLVYLVVPLQPSFPLRWEKLAQCMQRLSQQDWKVVESVGVRTDLVMQAQAQGGKLEERHVPPEDLRRCHRLYASFVLTLLLQEAPEENADRIASKFDLSRGDIQNLQQSTRVFAAMVAVFCEELGLLALAAVIRDVRKRLHFGKKEELQALMTIEGATATLATVLYDLDMRTPADVLASSDKELEQAVRLYFKRLEGNRLGRQTASNSGPRRLPGPQSGGTHRPPPVLLPTGAKRPATAAGMPVPPRPGVLTALQPGGGVASVQTGPSQQEESPSSEGPGAISVVSGGGGAASGGKEGVKDSFSEQSCDGQVVSVFAARLRSGARKAAGEHRRQLLVTARGKKKKRYGPKGDDEEEEDEGIVLFAGASSSSSSSRQKGEDKAVVSAKSFKREGGGVGAAGDDEMVDVLADPSPEPSQGFRGLAGGGRSAVPLAVHGHHSQGVDPVGQRHGRGGRGAFGGMGQRGQDGGGGGRERAEKAGVPDPNSTAPFASALQHHATVASSTQTERRAYPENGRGGGFGIDDMRGDVDDAWDEECRMVEVVQEVGTGSAGSGREQTGPNNPPSSSTHAPAIQVFRVRQPHDPGAMGPHKATEPRHRQHLAEGLQGRGREGLGTNEMMPATIGTFNSSTCGPVQNPLVSSLSASIAEKIPTGSESPGYGGPSSVQHLPAGRNPTHRSAFQENPVPTNPTTAPLDSSFCSAQMCPSEPLCDGLERPNSADGLPSLFCFQFPQVASLIACTDDRVSVPFPSHAVMPPSACPALPLLNLIERPGGGTWQAALPDEVINTAQSDGQHRVRPTALVAGGETAATVVAGGEVGGDLQETGAAGAALSRVADVLTRVGRRSVRDADREVTRQSLPFHPEGFTGGPCTLEKGHHPIVPVLKNGEFLSQADRPGDSGRRWSLQSLPALLRREKLHWGALKEVEGGVRGQRDIGGASPWSGSSVSHPYRAPPHPQSAPPFLPGSASALVVHTPNFTPAASALQTPVNANFSRGAFQPPFPHLELTRAVANALQPHHHRQQQQQQQNPQQCTDTNFRQRPPLQTPLHLPSSAFALPSALEGSSPVGARQETQKRGRVPGSDRPPQSDPMPPPSPLPVPFHQGAKRIRKDVPLQKEREKELMPDGPVPPTSISTHPPRKIPPILIPEHAENSWVAARGEFGGDHRTPADTKDTSALRTLSVPWNCPSLQSLLEGSAVRNETVRVGECLDTGLTGSPKTFRVTVIPPHVLDLRDPSKIDSHTNAGWHSFLEKLKAASVLALCLPSTGKRKAGEEMMRQTKTRGPLQPYLPAEALKALQEKKGNAGEQIPPSDEPIPSLLVLFPFCGSSYTLLLPHARASDQQSPVPSACDRERGRERHPKVAHQQSDRLRLPKQIASWMRETTNVAVVPDAKVFTKSFFFSFGFSPKCHLSDPVIASWVLDPENVGGGMEGEQEGADETAEDDAPSAADAGDGILPLKCCRNFLSRSNVRLLFEVAAQAAQSSNLSNGTRPISSSHAALSLTQVKSLWAVVMSLSVMMNRMVSSSPSSEGGSGAMLFAFRAVEIPTAVLLARMEAWGMPVLFGSAAAELEEAAGTRLTALEKLGQEIGSRPVRWLSTEDVNHLLFRDLGVPAQVGSGSAKAGRGVGKGLGSGQRVLRRVLSFLTSPEGACRMSLQRRRIAGMVAAAAVMFSLQQKVRAIKKAAEESAADTARDSGCPACGCGGVESRRGSAQGGEAKEGSPCSSSLFLPSSQGPPRMSALSTSTEGGGERGCALCGRAQPQGSLRVRCTWLQTHSVTGRLQTRSPNLLCVDRPFSIVRRPPVSIQEAIEEMGSLAEAAGAEGDGDFPPVTQQSQGLASQGDTASVGGRSSAFLSSRDARGPPRWHTRLRSLMNFEPGSVLSPSHSREASDRALPFVVFARNAKKEVRGGGRRGGVHGNQKGGKDMGGDGRTCELVEVCMTRSMLDPFADTEQNPSSSSSSSSYHWKNRTGGAPESGHRGTLAVDRRTLADYWRQQGHAYPDAKARRIRQVRVAVEGFGGRQTVLTYPADQVFVCEAAESPRKDLMEELRGVWGWEDLQGMGLGARCSSSSGGGFSQQSEQSQSQSQRGSEKSLEGGDGRGGPLNFELNLRSLFACDSSMQWVLVSLDFCQLELRLLAHFSGDPRLCELFAADKDPFLLIAASWLQIDPDEVTAEQRAGAKRLCYAVVYGMGSKSLAEELEGGGFALPPTADPLAGPRGVVGGETGSASGSSENEGTKREGGAGERGVRRTGGQQRESGSCCVEEAEGLQRAFLSHFKTLAAFIQQQKSETAVTSLAGRTRTLLPAGTSAGSGAASRLTWRAKARAERQAVNSLCQASAADVAKVAMVRVQAALDGLAMQEGGSGARLGSFQETGGGGLQGLHGSGRGGGRWEVKRDGSCSSAKSFCSEQSDWASPSSALGLARTDMERDRGRPRGTGGEFVGRVVMQLHDELLLEVRRDRLAEV
eukprot:Cvel_20081.t1-p1 / transcript=Cvel_20081.t1 / gene=Cvel_20081 / organism=Chromera_velia_CCMP2878 / gene_product=DNA polymerase theta, putative / transcript_product=DNA polymerase theta, putative / location=Cvel_scaffold1777:134-16153(-) / protein_length=3351 / sequence_SO=supercontig / SO=protein_coding / is_pseudo=false